MKRTADAPQFRCFPARQTFSPIAEAVLYVLKRARGFTRSRGMTVGDVRRMIRWEINIDCPRDIVHEGIAELQAAGFARKTDAYRWKFDRCTKHGDQRGNNFRQRHQSFLP